MNQNICIVNYELTHRSYHLMIPQLRLGVVSQWLQKGWKQKEGKNEKN